MEFDIKLVDCAGDYGPGNPPTLMLRREQAPPGDDRWYVAATPILDGQLEWVTSTVSSDYLRIPMYSYTLPAHQGLAVLSGVQFGLVALGNLALPSPPRRVILASNTLTHTGEPLQRFWLGLALLVAEH